jgi:hypothetical protein
MSVTAIIERSYLKKYRPIAPIIKDGTVSIFTGPNVMLT